MALSLTPTLPIPPLISPCSKKCISPGASPNSNSTIRPTGTTSIAPQSFLAPNGTPPTKPGGSATAAIVLNSFPVRAGFFPCFRGVMPLGSSQVAIVTAYTANCASSAYGASSLPAFAAAIPDSANRIPRRFASHFATWRCVQRNVSTSVTPQKTWKWRVAQAYAPPSPSSARFPPKSDSAPPNLTSCSNPSKNSPPLSTDSGAKPSNGLHTSFSIIGFHTLHFSIFWSPFVFPDLRTEGLGLACAAFVNESLKRTHAVRTYDSQLDLTTVYGFGLARASGVACAGCALTGSGLKSDHLITRRTGTSPLSLKCSVSSERE